LLLSLQPPPDEVPQSVRSVGDRFAVARQERVDLSFGDHPHRFDVGRKIAPRREDRRGSPSGHQVSNDAEIQVTFDEREMSNRVPRGEDRLESVSGDLDDLAVLDRLIQGDVVAALFKFRQFEFVKPHRGVDQAANFLRAGTVVDMNVRQDDRFDPGVAEFIERVDDGLQTWHRARIDENHRVIPDDEHIGRIVHDVSVGDLDVGNILSDLIHLMLSTLQSIEVSVSFDQCRCSRTSGSKNVETVNRATPHQGLQDFALDLVEPVALDELLSVLPKAFERLLPGNAWCADVLPVEKLAAETESRPFRACVPLRRGDRLIGAALLDWRGDDDLDPSIEPMLSAAAELAAVAILNRQRTVADKEQARAEAAELRFDLIGMLAHEMRTPLASIKGYSSALLLDEVTWDRETLVEFLRAIDEESDRLTEMVTHLLDSTVIEAGALELRREPVLLATVVRRTVEKMSHRTDRHRLITSFSDGFPVVYADEERVQQVLTNLLDNAIKYSPDGGLIIVSGEVHEDEVLVRVSDQGVGIAPEHLNKLFERFFRTEQRRIHGVSGTGLGLPIADAIVRAHGGRIWAESVVDEGTTLSFTLPIGAGGFEPGEDSPGEH
jgi:signal transduction histidine kinase